MSTISRMKQPLYLCLALLIMAGALPGCGNQSGAADSAAGDSSAQKAGEQQEDRVVRVRLEEVRPAPLQDILVLPAETKAASDVALSSERAGRVEWVGVTEGDEVTQGQVLVKIDLNSLAAALDRAQANYDLAVTRAQRRRQLHKNRVLSKEELDHAETELLKAASDLRTAKVYYEQGIVLAPISGTVERVQVDEGEYVKAGDVVVDIVDSSSLELEVNAPEMDVRFIQPGDKARVTVDAWPDAHWTGVVDFVSRRADASTKTFRVRVVVDNSDGRIRPGMIARARFVRREIKDAVTAPLFAVLDKGGERLVFVAEDGKAKARTVELGVINGERVQVLQGLAPGDQLIVEGQSLVEEGAEVSAQ